MKGFKKFLLIYVICFIVIGAAFLFGFHGFIAAYEKAQPVPFVKAYIAEGMPAALENEVEKLDAELTSAEDGIAYIRELYDASQLYRVTGTEYSLRVDGRELGRINIEKTDGKFGFNEWKLAGEEYDITPWLTFTEVSVPADYSVSINGNKLDSKYIVAEDTPYEVFSDAYEDFPELPKLVSYKSGAHFDKAEFEVKSADGTVISEINEQTFLSNCDEETIARLKSFTDDYINKYMTLIGNFSGNPWFNWSQINTLVRPTSPLDQLIRQALTIIAASPTSAYELKEIELITCSDLGDGRYFVDLCYKADITMNRKVIYQENHVRLVLCTNDKGKLLAEGMYNYKV